MEPWMSRGILISRKNKNSLAHLSIKNPSVINIGNFRKYRNLYNRVIREAKKLYFERQLADNQKNLRKTWKILFSAIHKNSVKSNLISKLTINGVDTDDPLSMAGHFNKFFTEIAEKTVCNLNPSNKSPDALIVQNPNKFKFTDKILTKFEILEATKLLLDKKTPDHTCISTNFIKQSIPVLLTPLFHVFNLSFSTGTVPIQFKIAKVIPIFKSGDKSSMDNYRPISLLSVFSKIMEKLVASRLLDFLNWNEILSKWQFGFRNGHSTIHPMTHFLNKIGDFLNNNKHSVAILFDLMSNTPTGKQPHLHFLRSHM